MWVAVGGTPESAIRAGSLGLPMALAIIGGMPEQFAPFAELYREAARQAGHDPAPALSINSHGFIAETSRSRPLDESFPLRDGDDERDRPRARLVADDARGLRRRRARCAARTSSAARRRSSRRSSSSTSSSATSASCCSSSVGTLPHDGCCARSSCSAPRSRRGAGRARSPRRCLTAPPVGRAAGSNCEEKPSVLTGPRRGPRPVAARPGCRAGRGRGGVIGKASAAGWPPAGGRSRLEQRQHRLGPEEVGRDGGTGLEADRGGVDTLGCDPRGAGVVQAARGEEAIALVSFGSVQPCRESAPRGLDPECGLLAFRGTDNRTSGRSAKRPGARGGSCPPQAPSIG